MSVIANAPHFLKTGLHPCNIENKFGSVKVLNIGSEKEEVLDCPPK